LHPRGAKLLKIGWEKGEKTAENLPPSPPVLTKLLILNGGEGGIRTHGTREGSTVFEYVPVRDVVWRFVRNCLILFMISCTRLLSCDKELHLVKFGPFARRLHGLLIGRAKGACPSQT
jgi:hypothetical protein